MEGPSGEWDEAQVEMCRRWKGKHKRCGVYLEGGLEGDAADVGRRSLSIRLVPLRGDLCEQAGSQCLAVTQGQKRGVPVSVLFALDQQQCRSNAPAKPACQCRSRTARDPAQTQTRGPGMHIMRLLPGLLGSLMSREYCIHDIG